MRSTKHIKTLLLSIVMLTGATASFAKETIERQTVYSLVKQKQTVEWYAAQAKLWKEYLDENPKDGEGWI
ncbi:MAG: hypothetical protein ACPGYY_02795, partial [Bacteroidia bacterium]